MTSWSDGPFDRVERLAGLTVGTVISDTGGQARRVCRLESHPGWLYKEYRSQIQPAEVGQLDRLINLPAGLGAADRELIDRNTSWPVTRVVEGATTVGVILPHAPDSFAFARTNSRGRIVTKPLPFDLLALRDDQMAARDLPALPLAARVTVCSSLVAVGALFERQQITYLDWSYKNAFWSVGELAAYVIDVDGCSFGPRPQVESPGWEDPHVAMRIIADNGVDRYRVALLVARCLTGTRDAPAVPAAIRDLGRSVPALQDVSHLVVRSLEAPSVESRPPLVELSNALTDAVMRVSGLSRPTHNVVGWRPVGSSRPPAGATTGPVPPRPARAAPVRATEPGPTGSFTPIQGEPPRRTGLYVLLFVATFILIVVMISFVVAHIF